MKVLAILGTLGSGKTTLINQVLPRFKDLRVLVVVNDVGSVNIDAMRIEHVGEVKALTAGCIGCSDLPAFKQLVTEVKSTDNVDLLIIEPTGIADGREVKSAVESVGISCCCLTLMDAKHFNRNRALNTLPTQLAVADAVLITWLSGNGNSDEIVPSSVMEYIGEHASGRLVERSISITDANGLSSLVSYVLSVESQGGLSKPIHNHHHTHEHGHGDYPYSVLLRSECTFEDLVLAIAPFREVLLRAKGVVAGRDFDFVQGDLVLGKPRAERPYANFISAFPLIATALQSIEVSTVSDLRTKKELMRSGEGIPLKDTLDAIWWQLEEYPPVVGVGLLRVDYEADVAYQIAHRPGVPKEYWRMVLQKYFDWRIMAGREIGSGRWDAHPDLPYWKRRVGMNLAWHMHNYPDDLNPQSVATAIDLRPASMTLEGLQELQILSFAEEMAEERPEIVKQVVEFGLAHEKLKNVQEPLFHCLKLSASNPEWEMRWKKVIAELGY